MEPGSSGPYPRTFRGFLRAIRESPGFWFRMTALLAFGSSLAAREGVRAVLTTFVAAVVIGTLIGYPLFLKRGRVP